jgi:hypothetical protein
LEEEKATLRNEIEALIEKLKAWAGIIKNLVHGVAGLDRPD